MSQPLRGAALVLALIGLLAAAGAALDRSPAARGPSRPRRDPAERREPAARSASLAIPRPPRPTEPSEHVQTTLVIQDAVAWSGRVRLARLDDPPPPKRTPVTRRPRRATTAQPSTTARPATRGSLGYFTVTCYALRGRTATGRPVSTSVVAVDPRRVPLGSRLYIAGVGVRIAADTGGSVKGQRLDIWLPSTDACMQFGTRRLAVSLA